MRSFPFPLAHYYQCRFFGAFVVYDLSPRCQWRCYLHYINYSIAFWHRSFFEGTSSKSVKVGLAAALPARFDTPPSKYMCVCVAFRVPVSDACSTPAVSEAVI